MSDGVCKGEAYNNEQQMVLVMMMMMMMMLTLVIPFGCSKDCDSRIASCFKIGPSPQARLERGRTRETGESLASSGKFSAVRPRAIFLSEEQ